MDVLATCCIREFLKSEIIAENMMIFYMYTIITFHISNNNSLYRVLSHPYIPLENKKPFTSLLKMAFLETERDSLDNLKQVVVNE